MYNRPDSIKVKDRGTNKVDKIILFPKEQLRLEEEVRTAMKREDYPTALEWLINLLNHGCHSYANHIQILICWMKLKQWKEAERFCEDLLENRNDPHYMDYTDYYVMILYETAQYHRVLAVLDEIDQKEIPEAMREKWEELKKLARKMNEWAARDLEEEFLRSAAEADGKRQYILLQKWKQREVVAPPSFYELLAEDGVHPLVKTEILRQLRSEKVEKRVEVKKKEQSFYCVPGQLDRIDDYPAYQSVLRQLKEVEQNDPTGFAFMKEVYDQYCEVMYPLLHEEEDAAPVAENLKVYVQSQFDGGTETQSQRFMDELMSCQQLYHGVTML